MKFESYWLDTAPPFEHAESAPPEGRFDVAVVGGGFTGLSAARTLSRAGASVALFEAGRIIGEASGRNGGQCNTGVAQDYGALVARLGRDRAQRCYRAYADAVESVERVIRDERIDCNFLRHGKLKLAAKPAHYEQLARTCELIRQDVDRDVEMIPASRIGEEVASPLFHGGLLQRNGGQMHMGRFGVGLATAAARHGASIFEHAAVSAIDRRASGVRIATARGEIEAKQVLISTGASQTGPLQWYRRRMAPVGSFIVVTEPLDRERLDRLLPKRRAYVTSRIIGHYFRVTPDDRLLFGGRARFAMSNVRSDAKSGALLRAGLEATFPELAGVKLDYCWGGLVDMTRDRLPRAGSHDGLYHSMGYSGHGVQMSVHMGERMAATLLGAADANPWADFDWPAIPGHFGKPWFLPLVGAWYRLQDRLH
ncbi:NAD(P)/FAD-dependent oxidoreductase [Halotalea alkalilenta]|uniref:NAD(P)/FAD-dependent oxidoreductase n=1 Tax=Halotalea alkalilenta TaxID=376489 RepID=UPI000480EDC1|nr:FAD-binding oxidoreductase [Halotalea alkalilenta]